MSVARRALIAWVVANIVFGCGILQIFEGDKPLLQAQIDAAFYVVMGIAWLLCSALIWFAIKGHYKNRNPSRVRSDGSRVNYLQSPGHSQE